MLTLSRIFNLAAIAAFFMTCVEAVTPGRVDVAVYYCIATVLFLVLGLFFDDCHHDKQRRGFPYD
jgi:hypothetical protein